MITIKKGIVADSEELQNLVAKELEKVAMKIGKQFINNGDGTEDWRFVHNEAISECYNIVLEQIAFVRGELTMNCGECKKSPYNISETGECYLCSQGYENFFEPIGENNNESK